ncbi:unnamed protein product [Polarella glacialis]|uniref:Uncharacterized protein n=1 Tax=Polarella glacialis TaxID=89957 RepID=A0A813DUP4_POLGL|nr:unnamed protein product [Polarella glacialis]
MTDTDLSGELIRRLEPAVAEFVAGMPDSLSGWGGGAFVEVLHRIGVDNFGKMGSQRALAKMGFAEPPSQFVQRAQHRIQQAVDGGDARKETWGLMHKRVLCYAEWDVLLSTGEPIRGTLMRENGIRIGHMNPPAWLRAFATPINSIIGRDLCGEFQLATGIGLILDAAPPGHLTGEVHLFSSTTPCCSCLAVLCQLQQRFSGLRMSFANGEQYL